MIGQQSSQPRRPVPVLTRQPSTPPPQQRFAVRVVILYSVLILLVAAWSSYAGYNWARHRVLQSMVLPSITMLGQHALGSQTTSQVGNVPVAESANPNEVSTVALQPINVLLMGTDERPQEYGSANTDTLILLTLDPATQQAGMLSFSRDLWVNVPALGEKEKINTIYGVGEQNGYSGGGPQLLMDTISSMIGQPIPYYIRINFDSFVQIVDMIGGIDINVPKTINDEEYPTADYGIETFHLDAGPQHLDGETALKYARTRHVDDDYGRQRRQQDVIRAVFDKIRRRDMFPTLISNLPSMLNTLRKSVQHNFWGELPLIVSYANFLRQNKLQGIQQEVIDKRYGTEDYNSIGQWILIPKPSEVRVAVNRYFAKLTTESSADGNVDSSWVRIEVLNGTDKAGVAAATRDLLRQRGWNVVSINDADRDDYAETLVVNYGAPDNILKKMNSDLKLQPNLNNFPGLSQKEAVDVKIIVGRDLLTQLGIAEQ